MKTRSHVCWKHLVDPFGSTKLLAIVFFVFASSVLFDLLTTYNIFLERQKVVKSAESNTLAQFIFDQFGFVQGCVFIALVEFTGIFVLTLPLLFKKAANRLKPRLRIVNAAALLGLALYFYIAAAQNARDEPLPILARRFFEGKLATTTMLVLEAAAFTLLAILIALLLAHFSAQRSSNRLPQ